jgi:hypothetical protein
MVYVNTSPGDRVDTSAVSWTSSSGNSGPANTGLAVRGEKGIQQIRREVINAEYRLIDIAPSLQDAVSSSQPYHSSNEEEKQLEPYYADTEMPVQFHWTCWD